VIIHTIHKSPLRVRLASLANTKKRISGPILDRIDIHIEVPSVEYEKLSSDRMGDGSASIRARVQAARDNQTRRFSGNCSADIVAMPICVWGRFGSSASFLMKVKA
jgi:magnesium chelatase family protein